MKATGIVRRIDACVILNITPVVCRYDRNAC